MSLKQSTGPLGSVEPSSQNTGVDSEEMTSRDISSFLAFLAYVLVATALVGRAEGGREE